MVEKVRVTVARKFLGWFWGFNSSEPAGAVTTIQFSNLIIGIV
jgi:hypothetical protein